MKDHDDYAEVVDIEARANEVRYRLNSELQAIVTDLNAAKREYGLNVNFVLTRGQDGLFSEDVTIHITKDL